MDREELKAIVAQMLRELAPAQTPPSPPPVKGAETAPEAPPDDGVLPDLTTVDLRAQYLVPNAAHGAEFRALKAKDRPPSGSHAAMARATPRPRCCASAPTTPPRRTASSPSCRSASGRKITIPLCRPCAKARTNI